MPLCVCGPCWGDLGDILRLQEASGPNMIGLTDWQISPLWRCFKQRIPEGLRNAEGGLPCEHMALQYFGMHSHANERLPSWTCTCTLMQGNIPAFRESQAQTLIHKQVQLAQRVTWAQLHTQWPLWIHHQPLTAQIHTEYMCLHSHSFPSTHGFMSEHSPVDLWPIQASKHTQGHTIWLMECIHKDPPMHTHICLNEGFGLGNSFSRNKNKCQKEKKNQTNKPEHGELHKQKRARTYTHTVEAVSQSGLSSQLQLSACWVCFPWVQTSGEPHRFQAYVSMAAGQTDLCQESPSSLLTDHNKNWPFPPRAARSKILPQALFSF